MYPEPSTAQRVLSEATKGASKRLKVIKRNLGVNTPGLADYFLFGGGRKVASGASVTEGTALRVSTVLACIAYITNSVASLPKITYRRTTGSNKERATNHPLYNVIGSRPNPLQNDFEFCETLQGHALLWGNAYAEIEQDGAGRVKNLWPLRPDRMKIDVTPVGLVYTYITPSGEEVVLRNVMHLRGLGNDGLIGYSPIQLARESIGLAMAEEEYRSRFFGNNASPGGILSHPHTLGKQAMDNLREQWETAHAGLSQAHRVAILEEGMTWQQIGLPAKDLEFIEGRKYQALEICRIFNVRPYKIGIMEPGTVSYASVEQQSIDSYIDTVRPWLCRWERKFNDLFREEDRRDYFVEFLLDAVLRGDSKTRAEVLRIWRDEGIINANEWRALENMNEIPDEGGADYWRPSNFVVVGQEQLALPNTQPNGVAKPLANGAAH
jgi:HK97 family phage portal protein